MADVHDPPPAGRRAEPARPPQWRNRDVIATASHEFRTSLRALQATLELVREEVLRGSADSDATVGYVEIALRRTRNLVRVTTDLLDIARLDAGIAPEEREHTFGSFARGRSAAGAAHGAGLGLTVARGLARAMGGNVDVAAAPAGAHLRVTLRAATRVRPWP